jgi:hypothetical protein
MDELRKDGWVQPLVIAGVTVERQTDVAGKYTGIVHVLTPQGRAEKIS